MLFQKNHVLQTLAGKEVMIQSGSYARGIYLHNTQVPMHNEMNETSRF